MLTNHIFFHDDVDGIISASIFLHDNINDRYRLYPLSSSMRGDKFNDLFYSVIKHKESKKIILDYQYNEDADLWVDHHFDPEFGECAIRNENIIYDPKEKSAASLMAQATQNLERSWSTCISRDNLMMVNVVDSGSYASIDQIFKDRSPIMILRAYLERTFPVEMTYCRIVEIISYSNMNIEEALFKMKIGPYYVHELEKNAIQIKGSMIMVKKMSIVRQKRINQFPRYAEYFVMPELKYSLRLTQAGNNNIYFQLGYNSWQNESNKFNIGKILIQMNHILIRGGGHFNVGGGTLKEENVEQFIDEISKILNEEDTMEMEKYAVDSTDPVEKKATELIKEGSAKNIDDAREASVKQLKKPEDSNGSEGKVQ